MHFERTRCRADKGPRPVFERTAVAVAGQAERYPEVRARALARVRALGRRSERPAPHGRVESRHNAVAVHAAVHLFTDVHAEGGSRVHGRQVVAGDTRQAAAVHRVRIHGRAAGHGKGFVRVHGRGRDDSAPGAGRCARQRHDVTHAERHAPAPFQPDAVRAQVVACAVQSVARL